MCLSYEKGFVMLSVLVMMQIFSLISLQGLLLSTEQLKIAQNSLKSEKYRRQALAILSQIEQSPFNDKCMIAPLPSKEFSSHSMLWWNTYSCSGNFDGNEYYYVIEWIGQDARIAMYYRITLLAFPNETRLLLQSTVAKPGGNAASGRQMWRQLV